MALRAWKFITVLHQLRVMRESFAHAVGLLICMTLMLTFIFYIFGLVIMQGVADRLMLEIE